MQVVSGPTLLQSPLPTFWYLKKKKQNKIKKEVVFHSLFLSWLLWESLAQTMVEATLRCKHKAKPKNMVFSKL